jgi:hypothetical protein
MSVASRPLLLYPLISCARLDEGGRRSFETTLEFAAVVESLLPRRTVHDGPPSCEACNKHKSPRYKGSNPVDVKP